MTTDYPIFQKGDKVTFVDKYGKRQVGSYQAMSDYDADLAVVTAKAFADLGDDSDIWCLVPLNALEAVK